MEGLRDLRRPLDLRRARPQHGRRRGHAAIPVAKPRHLPPDRRDPGASLRAAGSCSLGAETALKLELAARSVATPTPPCADRGEELHRVGARGPDTSMPL